MKKTAFYIVVTLWCTAPVFAAPSHTSATFPANGFMLEDYTYTNAATATNMAGVYENSVNANPNYNDCPANSWCDSSGQHACSSLSGSYTSSATGSTANTDCYKACTVATANIAHATAVTGNDYYGAGTDTCSATSCENGYHINSSLDLNTVIGTTAGGLDNNNTYGYIYNNGGGNQNTTTYGLTENGTFAVEYANNKGIIKGRAQCSSQVPANPWYNDANYTFSEGNIVSTLPDSTGQYCYCTLDSYTPVGESPISLSGPWVYNRDYEEIYDCETACAFDCLYLGSVTESADLAFRAAVFGSMTGGTATCEITDITVGPGEYLPAGTETPVQCTAGSYCPGLPNPVHYDADNNQGITQCTAGSFSAAGASECTVCPADTYSAAGATACTSCATNYHITGNTFADHDSATDCTITCNGGYYLRTANDATCTAVGAGKYAPSSTITQGSVGTFSACPTGLTTIGYGPGADEAGDCGRKFHAGNGVLYLRSTKKTDLALNVRVGDAIFYGNMSTSEKNMSDSTTKKLKVKYGDTVYHVYDDSVDEGVMDGFTKLEYIQSRGTQYINTQITPTDETEVTTRVYSSGTSSWYVFGARTGSGGTILFAQSGAQSGSKVSATVNGVASRATTDGTEWDRSSDGASIYDIRLQTDNGTANYSITNETLNKSYSSSFSYTPMGTQTAKIGVLGYPGAGNVLSGTTRVYSFRILKSGVLVFNGVPCKRNSDNEVGLCDMVTGTFFGNAGSGVFTSGT